MAWLKRWWNKMRNYTSGGDYPGSYGGGGGGGSGSKAKAHFEVETVRFKDTNGPTS